jgi:serine/threonine protein kinase/WD40 repeat protein
VDVAAQSMPAEVGRYRILRPLGHGGMGSVFLARDVRLGRLVALKLLAQDLLGSEALRAQFELEARATASLAHPNVVTLYDVGEHEGRPWVALEYIEGMTLAQRLAADWPSAPEAVRLALAVARAIDAAHAAGIVHRDLKPGNVLLGRDGRPRVVDFGLARFTARRPGAPEPGAPADLTGAAGTPRYMAPEQWEGRDGPASDIWALGVMLQLLFSGRPAPREAVTRTLTLRPQRAEPPAPAPDLSAVRPDLAPLVRRCLSLRPEARPTAAELVTALAALDTDKRSPRPSESPFRGLSAFTERQAHLFFGRDAEVAAFVERLRDSGTMTVVGSSGAGKSSFLLAGVVPRLREAGPQRVLLVRPQARPLHALAEALLGHRPLRDTDSSHDYGAAGAARAPNAPEPEATSQPQVEALVLGLQANPDVLAVKLAELAEQQQARVLLIVDQLEEVVTVTADEAERRAFLDALGSAGAEPNEPVRVLMSVRDDFFGRIPWGRSASRVLSGVMPLAPPEPDVLREVVRRPLEAAGFAFDDPALLDAMVEDVRGEAARLPLLQFALSLMWARRDEARSLLLRADYERMGGVGGALAAHAEDVLSTLGPADVELCRGVLLRLVTEQRTRRAQPRAALTEGLGDGADALVTRLVGARLLSVQRGGGDHVELAHEALTRLWPRLSRWIEDSHEDLAVAVELEAAAERWERRGRSPDGLWTGEALRDAERLVARGTTRLTDSARALVRASDGRARLQATRRRLALTAVVGGALLAALASSTAAWALRARQRDASVAARKAEEARGLLLEERALASFAAGEVHEARAQLRAALEARDSLRLRALAQKLDSEPLRFRVPDDTVYDARLLSQGRSLVTARQSGTVEVVDPVTLERRALRGHTDQVISAVALSGGRLASASYDGEVYVWELDAGRGTRLVSRRGLLALAAHGDVLAVPSEGRIELFDVRDLARPPRVVDAPVARPFGVAFSADGRALYVATSDGRVQEVDVEAGRLTRATAPGEPVFRLALAGGRLFLTRKSGQLECVDLSSLQSLWTRDAHQGPVRGLVVARDGRVVTAGAFDHRLVLRSAADGHELLELPTKLQSVMQLTLAEDGQTLLAAGVGGVEAWDLSRVPDEPRAAPHAEAVVALRFSADGAGLFSGSESRFVGWRTHSGAPNVSIERDASRGRGLALDASSGQLIATDARGGLVLWDLSSRRLVATVGNEAVLPQCLDFDPVSGLALVGTVDGSVIIGWPRERRAGPRLRLSSSEVRDVFIARGGRRGFAATLDGRVFALDLGTARVTEVYRHAGRLLGLGGTPEGETLFLSGFDGEAVRLEVASRRAEALFSMSGRLADPAVSPDGRVAVFPGSDGRAYVVETGAPVRAFTVMRGEVNVAALDPSGRRLAVAGDDQTVRVFDLATGAPEWRAEPDEVTAGAGFSEPPDGGVGPAWRDMPAVGRVHAFPYGAVELLPADGGPPRPLRDVPKRSARLALEGPPGTLALGFEDGTFGLWDTASGDVLVQHRLHGAVVGLRVEGSSLLGASELGDRAAVQVGLLGADGCALLEQVRRDIPFSWRDGALVRQASGPPCDPALRGGGEPTREPRW